MNKKVVDLQTLKRVINDLVTYIKSNKVSFDIYEFTNKDNDTCINVNNINFQLNGRKSVYYGFKLKCLLCVSFSSDKYNFRSESNSLYVGDLSLAYDNDYAFDGSDFSIYIESLDFKSIDSDDTVKLSEDNSEIIIKNKNFNDGMLKFTFTILNE